ncbi:C2 calcium-dependent domain-containing protein 4C [Varanus komodoensis]|uniref:C2 calcium-dependent domain-containing protein 4C-like n=1 Tax=Varanus komodoensis TaxID=61221 RepID=UPI001CF7C43F|nr:C2 calcium-dependent domain-containing protein 4C-like [Varanus komodoensis]KAF7241541.1 C2 calcium-dependent domain-containing protein 4C [Varanus komodoensis]
MWFLDKVRAPARDASPPGASLLGAPPASPVPDKGKAAGAPAAAFANVLTPDRIPEFCIPPRLASLPQAKSPHPAFQPRRCLTEPGLQEAAASAAGGSPSPPLPHLIQVESVELADELDEEGTDADPRSRAALSLPHFPKAHTSYGFCTLLESPHTRRKESIFHSGSLPSLAAPRPRASSYGGREGSAGPGAAPGAARARRPLLGRRGAWESSDTGSSTESSPFGSPRLGRSPPRLGALFKAHSQDGPLCRALRGRGRAGSLSMDEASSADSSPSATRRSSEALLDAPPGRAYGLAPLPGLLRDLPGGRERLGRDGAVLLDKGGLLRLSCEYCPDNRRLRLRLISAEGLYQASAEPRAINCCVSFALMPGKAQKQRSTVIKHSRNPIFNEDFFFLGISEDDVYSLSVRMKAVNKGCSMKRDLLLGESHVALVTLLAA